MISDNLARAFDLAGENLWIDSNRYNNTGSSPGNDGEGIVCQAHGGTHINSWAVTHNVGSGRGNGRGYILAWAIKVQGLLIAFNEISAQLGALNSDEQDAIWPIRRRRWSAPVAATCQAGCQPLRNA
jgi:hypothetical protein